MKVQKLTAEALLSAPRNGAAVPNYNGKLILYTVSTHIFGDKTVKQVRVMDIASGASEQLLQDEKAHDALWIPGTNKVVYLKSGDKGTTQVWLADGAEVSEEHRLLVEYDAPVSDLKLKRLDDSSIIFIVVGLVNDDGLLYNGELDNKANTARVFDTVNVRVWDKLYHPQRYSYWYNKLELGPSGQWQLPKALYNAINDPILDASGGMYELDGADSSFDISHRGIAFTARDLSTTDPLESWVFRAYFVPVDSFSLPPSQKPKRIAVPEDSQSKIAQNLRFSPDGSTIGFLLFTADRAWGNSLYLTSTNSLEAFDVFSLVNGTMNGPEDEPPQSFEFAGASDSIIVKMSKCGRSSLATLKLQDGEKPREIFNEGSVSAFYPLEQGIWDRILVTSTSFIDSGLWQIVSVPESKVARTIYSSTRNGAKFGLSKKMVSEIWFEGADERCVHSFIVKPSDFDEKKKYPWVLIPHGGPVSDWSDSWSNRWNMASWAEQGYVVILPNITGSIGYGLDFARGIENDWGGRPYQDLLNLIAYVEKLLYLHPSKAVLAGASYGGYMISWMLGHDIIKKFCGVVWHDGIYNTNSFCVQTDALVGSGNFGDSIFPWINPENLQRYNPAQPELLAKWCNAPPTLVVHSGKDYRCPITEGLAVFKVLQGHRVPSRFLTFTTEGHWVLDPENSLAWHQTVWDWVRRCVDGDVKRGDKTW